MLLVYLFNFLLQAEILNRLRSSPPKSQEQEKVDELRHQQEELQRALDDLENKKAELMARNAQIEAEINEAEARLAEKKEQERIEVEVDLGLDIPSDEGSIFSHPYYADLEAELALPSYPLALVEGLCQEVEVSEDSDSSKTSFDN